MASSNQDEIFLNSGIPTACPDSCVFKLSTNMRTADGDILHQSYTEKVPNGYIAINESKEFYCARSLGDCGAKAPIYRYRYKNYLMKGYAYSFRANQPINGYIREFNPICYGWKDGSRRISNDDEFVKTKDPTDCEPISDIANGQILYKPSMSSGTLIMGSIATLRCNNGYKRSVENEIICITGTWYPVEKLGECISASDINISSDGCAPLPQYENGHILYSEHDDSNNYPSGTLAYLICNDDYQLMNTTQAQCNHGQWSTMKLGICQPINDASCVPLPAVQNGKVKYIMGDKTNITVGTVAELECSPGHIINGADVLLCEQYGWSPTSTFGYCQQDMRWSEQREKRQEMKPCPASHPIISNGQLTFSNKPNSVGTYPSGTVAIIRCNAGYTNHGALLSVCDDSAWKPENLGTCTAASGIVPLPVGNPCVFGLLTPIGGTITYSKGSTLGPYPAGTIATLDCTHGISQGPSIAVCDNGLWIPNELGTCSSVQLGNSSNNDFVAKFGSCLNDYPVPDNGIIVYSTGAVRPPYPVLTTASIQCISGYIPLGTVIATCQNGKWYPPIPGKCIQPNTETPTNNLYNMAFSSTFVTPSSIATVLGSCATGIVPPANGYIAYSSGSITEPFPARTVATIGCNSGFKPIGAISSTCLNGIWSPLLLGQCVDEKSVVFGVPLGTTINAPEAPCAALTSPINGQISYSNGSEGGLIPSGTIATVVCNPNYTPIGLSTALCYNGVFSPLLLAQCVPKNVEGLLQLKELPCIPITKPSNGDITYSDTTATVYPSQTTATLACNFGFTPIGHWQPPLGFCQQNIIGPGINQQPVARQCLFELPAVPNGQIRYSAGNMLPPYSSGTTAALICNIGSIAVGTVTSTCTNGSWNPPLLGQCSMNDASYPRNEFRRVVLPIIGCTISPPVSNGKVYYNNVSKNNLYPTGTVANLICDDGYVLLGRSTSHCQGGIWSPWPGVGSCQPDTQQTQMGYFKSEFKPPGACTDITITPANGMIIYEDRVNGTTWYNNGTSARLQCRPGYMHNSKQPTYCKNGTWLPPIGMCKSINGTTTGGTCEPFNSPSNGKIYYIYNNYMKDYQIGTTAILSCNKGYRLDGQATLICQENGWMPESGFGICIFADDNFRMHL
uniref:Sushi domain-containing protein n=1 Tax=Setaria digitata TaxID=48799 RepID=A0A915PX47_9BILA